MKNKAILVGTLSMSILMISSSAFALKTIYFCPKNFYITCMKAINNNGKYSVCTAQGMSKNWVFAAPYHVITGEQPGVPFSGIANQDTAHTSTSTLAPGKYIAKYLLAYYGPLTNIEGNYAYCFYQVNPLVASIPVNIAGLYSSDYKMTGNNWTQPTPNHYICQAGRLNCFYVNN